MKSRGKREWSVYLVRCADGSLYTGVAKDVEARVEKHNKGVGAAYTRSHRPVTLVHHEKGFTRSKALIREAQIKRYPRPKKEALVFPVPVPVPSLVQDSMAWRQKRGKRPVHKKVE
ncbi:MAG: GIY-YIG nuclease family protein [Elusimicrobia bacterium]|nr:GIY-YIG nuclease family protein [Elusimicrobiota bacterium]MBP9127529.1 GIY-YIG nuclease family protein [Elusimicrobiota bacterium]